MSSTGVATHQHEPSHRRLVSSSVLEADVEGDVGSANIDRKNDDGRTALHLAIIEGRDNFVRILLRKRANVEAAANNGNKPLYVASILGLVSMVRLLLDHGANVESYNAKTQMTALYQATLNGYPDIVRILLQNGANVDAQIPAGDTALICATKSANADIVELLLFSGANKDVQLPNGPTALHFALYKTKIWDLLTQTRLNPHHQMLPDDSFQNRLLRGPDNQLPPISYKIKGNNENEKLNACHSFQVTLMDFFDSHGPVHEVATVHDVLYGRGVNSIMATAREAGMTRGEPAFRWIHLPANNTEWARKLIKRIFRERHLQGAKLDKNTTSMLGLTDASSQYFRATTANSSFMRPMCRRIGAPIDNGQTASKKDHVLLFLPYLHHEHAPDFRLMTKAITDIKIEALQLGLPKFDPVRPTYTRMARRWIELETLDNFRIDYQLDENPEYVLIKRWVPEYEQDFLWNHTKQLRDSWERRWERRGLAKTAEHSQSEVSSVAREETLTWDWTRLGWAVDWLREKFHISRNKYGKDGFCGTEFVVESNGNTQVENGESSAKDEEDNGPSKPAISPAIRRALENNLGPGQDDITGNAPLAQGSYDQKRQATEAEGNLKGPQADDVDSKACLLVDNINHSLIKGYLLPSKRGAFPALQPRRSLDQYFYTHLQDTSKRDQDQVVYRYLEKESRVPQLFMVDQLWIWILNEDTVISCCPQVWRTWETDPTGQSRESFIDPGVRLRHRDDRDEPMNVSDMVLKAIRKSGFPAISSVYKLSEVIINACTSTFDQYRVPEDFQFFDFFERSIGKVTEKEAECFQLFNDIVREQGTRDDVKLDALFDITTETSLLVEIKDIRDELGILRTVLIDQSAVLRDFNEAVFQLNFDGTDSFPMQSQRTEVKQNEVLETNIYRIEKMEKLAAKTYEAVNHLLDLKQKQANASEARSARKQAEATRFLAEEAAKQSVDSARQGKTVLVFTVVTIIFLPLSFMAAVFAINADGFPLNHNGKLSLGYVLKYIFTISAAVSIAFSILAFQYETLTRSLKHIGRVATECFPRRAPDEGKSKGSI